MDRVIYLSNETDSKIKISVNQNQFLLKKEQIVWVNSDDKLFIEQIPERKIKCNILSIIPLFILSVCGALFNLVLFHIPDFLKELDPYKFKGVYKICDDHQTIHISIKNVPSQRGSYPVPTLKSSDLNMISQQYVVDYHHIENSALYCVLNICSLCLLADTIIILLLFSFSLEILILASIMILSINILVIVSNIKRIDSQKNELYRILKEHFNSENCNSSILSK